MRKFKHITVLGKKLFSIRCWKGLSQGKMLLIVMPHESEINRARVSQWELGTREPSIAVLTVYAGFAEITLDELLIDENKLPASITKTGNRKSSKTRRKAMKTGNRYKSKKVAHPAAETLQSAIVNEVAAKPVNNRKTKDKIGEMEQQNNNQKYDSRDPDGSGKNTATDDEEVIEQTEEISSVRDNINDNKRQYLEDLSALTFVIGETEERELITLDLPTVTLDRLHDMFLKLQLSVPRQNRSQMTLETLVDFCLKAVYSDYQSFDRESLIARQAHSFLGEKSVRTASNKNHSDLTANE